jgi:Fe-S cluster assembly ATP-binding protein
MTKNKPHNLLTVKNLSVSAHGKSILEKISFDLEENTLTVLAGANASGKTYLIQALFGVPPFDIAEGDIFFQSTNITKLSSSEKAKLGIFLAWQKIPTIDSLKTIDFLEYLDANNISTEKLGRDRIIKTGIQLGLNQKILERSFGVGFSGGELKRLELLQLFILKPRLAILDEIEAGLDVQSVAKFAKLIIKLKETTTLLVISHQLLWQKSLKPEQVLFLKDGMLHHSHL